MLRLRDLIEVLLDHELLVVPRLFHHTLVVALVERPKVVASFRGERNVLDIRLRGEIVF
jgi:hypothetical protein